MEDLETKYRALRATVKERGLMRRTHAEYFILAVCAFAGVLISLKIVTLTNNVWLQMLNAFFFTFALMQVGFLGHDFSHGQVFDSKKWNRFFSLGIWGLLLGGSESAWYERHNTHHEHVNQEGHDPDINIPFLFREGQQVGDFAFSSRALRYQHILFFVSLPVWYVSQLITVWGKAPKILSTFRGYVEVILAIVHFVVLFYFIFSNLPFITGGIFLLTHLLAIGFYLGVAFAPNHKGEEILSADTEMTWLHQITSTRNLFPNPLTFHVFAGLNFQIEHHLFPGAPRYQYPKIQKLVKQFCLENNIRYHETTWLGSMKEIYVALKREAERE